MQSLIRNRNQIKQVIDFTGIGNNKFHPTDIDAVFEFDNKVLILMEVKKHNNKLPIGQKLVLERIINSWHTTQSIALIVKHNYKNDNENIPLKECDCVGYFYQGNWWEVNIKLYDLLKKILTAWNVNKIKL